MTLDEINEKYLKDFLLYGLNAEERNGKFSCFNKSAHKHNDKNPSLSLYKGQDGLTHFKCFSCNMQGNITDLVEYKTGITDKKEIYKYLLEYYNLKDYESQPIIRKEKQQPMKETNVKDNLIDANKIDLSKAFERQRNKFSNLTHAEVVTDYEVKKNESNTYFLERGLTKEIIEEYKLSYGNYFTEFLDEKISTIFTEEQEKEKNLYLSEEERKNYSNIAGNNFKLDSFKGGVYYIPYINYKDQVTYFIARLKEKTNNAKYIKPAGLKQELFNERYIIQGQPIIFITEGQIDALAVEVAGQKGLATGGVGTTRLKELLTECKEKINESIFIIATDQDDAGRKASKELQNIFKDFNLSYMDYYDYLKENAKYNDIMEGVKDINDQLLKDKTLFIDAIKDASEEAIRRKVDVEKLKEEALKEAIESKTAFNYLPKFFDNIDTNLYDAIPTGIKNLDEELGGGFYTQSTNYIIGAPSVGKTTFALMLTEAFLNKDNYVMYFSLEMSKEQLLSKIISRNANRQLEAVATNRTITSLDVLRNAKNDNALYNILVDTQKNLEDKLKHLIIETFTSKEDATIEKILERVNQFKQINNGKAPIVFIDYLQLIDEDIKQNEKDEITLLKHASRRFKDYAIDNNTMFFLLTASNRASSKEGTIDMYSGRGGSSIEFGGDVVLAINFTDKVFPDYKEIDTSKGTKRKPIEVREEKLKDEKWNGHSRRRITITIEKNRLYKTGVYCNFNYNAEKNDITPTKDNKAYTKRGDVKEQYGGNVSDVEDYTQSKIDYMKY